MVTHRRGFLFQKKESFSFGDIQSIKFDQGIFGRLFNYGTVSLYDWKLRKNITLYLIHNPRRYFRIIRQYNPVAEIEEKQIRKKLIYNSD
jgi:hypothetical protein